MSRDHQLCIQYARNPAATREHLTGAAGAQLGSIDGTLRPLPVPRHPREGLTPEELARVAEVRRRYIEAAHRRERRQAERLAESLRRQQELEQIYERQQVQLELVRSLPEWQRTRYRTCLDLVRNVGAFILVLSLRRLHSLGIPSNTKGPEH